MHFETNYNRRTNPFFFTLAISKKGAIAPTKKSPQDVLLYIRVFGADFVTPSTLKIMIF